MFNLHNLPHRLRILVCPRSRPIAARVPAIRALRPQRLEGDTTAHTRVDWHVAAGGEHTVHSVGASRARPSDAEAQHALPPSTYVTYMYDELHTLQRSTLCCITSQIIICIGDVAHFVLIQSARLRTALSQSAGALRSRTQLFWLRQRPSPRMIIYPLAEVRLADVRRMLCLG